MPKRPRIDEERLEILHAIQDPTLFADLLALFQQQGPSALKRLRDAISARDAQELFRAAHSLKSQSGNIGAGLLHELCEQLELAARGGVEAWEVWARQVATIETEWGQALRLLKERVRE